MSQKCSSLCRKREKIPHRAARQLTQRNLDPDNLATVEKMKMFLFPLGFWHEKVKIVFSMSETRESARRNG